MKKNISLRTVVIAVIVTNLITASLIIFAPIPFIGGMRLVSGDEYSFVKQFGKMIRVKDVVIDNYVDKIDESKMVDGALKGMVANATDRYTEYMDEKEYKEWMTQTKGSYAGIGVYIEPKDGRILIVAPIEDGPAERAGVKSGDIITKINGTEVTADDIDKAVSMMTGKAGKKILLSIYREGVGNKEINLTTEKIVFKTVKSEMLKDNIGYIRITQFTETTGKDFENALGSLESKGMKGLVLDLRDNPGGLLEECVKVANKLVGEGTVVYTIDNKGRREEWTSDSDKISVPLAVLVNEGTASASEIVSGAIRDYKAGTLIGTKTFGKGLVQDIINLFDGTGVKVTIARYYTPSGECIQGKGITPDIVLPLPEKDKNRELKKDEDIQLQKAIEVVKSKR